MNAVLSRLKDIGCNLGLDALYYLNAALLELSGAKQFEELGEVLSCLRERYNQYVNIIRSAV